MLTVGRNIAMLTVGRNIAMLAVGRKSTMHKMDILILESPTQLS